MAIRIYKDKGELKHQHAFNEYGFVQAIDQAEKIVNGKEMKYYLFPDKVCELILRAGEKNQRHFALKNEGIEYNGKKYISDKESESPQHYDAKLKIIGQGFFDFDLYKIPVKNGRLERRFGKSYFRADLIAELDSGESIFVEIIKTSEPSEKKEKYIIENQLPTFKIYIDEKGDFIDEKFHFIGNREIESIRESIRKLLSKPESGYEDRFRLYQSITNLGERNKRLASEIKGMESLFIQTAPLVKWEWVEPRCTKEPQGKNRLLSLKYFMT
jgi:DNA-binding MarR family transcriptional regulator